MRQVFADTFYYLALMNQDDAAHAKAVAASGSLDCPTLTTAWVLTEVGDAFAAPPQRRVFLNLLEDLESDPTCTVLPASESLFQSGVALYRRRPDKEWSLTDRVSFAAMREHGITEVLTEDHHFEQAGFTVLLKPWET